MHFLKVCLFKSSIVCSDAWNFVHAIHPLEHTGVFGLHRKVEILLVGLRIGSIQLQDLHYVLQLVEHCDVSHREVWASDVHFWCICFASSDLLSFLDRSHKLRKRLVPVHRLNLDIVIRSNLLF
jgi:hypothetical protein